MSLIAEKRIKVNSCRDLTDAEVDQISEALDDICWADLARQKLEEAGVNMDGILVAVED